MSRVPTAGTRKPYGGPVRSLVIAIDVGTTFSGVSYAILEPGEIPKINGITRFPGQEHIAGNTKIPSILYYDKHGNVVAAGAEADSASIIARAEEEELIRVELFKLRLRPRTMQLNMNGMRFSLLPKKKTPVHVFGDFLRYMYYCTKKFITDTHAKGTALWRAVEGNIQFVLSHPNGWEGPQQSKMRRAAIYGGLIPDTNEGKARIWFVTEGEASLHACVLSGLAHDVLSSPSQHGFLIADAGGGTLDISSYAIRGTDPLVIEEVAPPDCIFAGSVFVSRRARQFLEEKLKNSKYGTPDALDHITRKFDETTKRLFRDIKDLAFIHFGSPLDKDPSVGIRNGQLKLTGTEVASLFEPSVDAAVRAIKAQIDASKGIVRSVFLVGGYAASPWLFSQLKERLEPRVIVSRPDSQTSKAVADGAVGFFCDHHVAARMSKFMYGVEYLREFDPASPDHVSRRGRLCELPSGPRLLPDAFDCILARGVKVKESTVFTRKYSTELTSLSLLSLFEVEVWCYRGGSEIPLWIDRHSDAFSTLCIVQADLSVLSGSAAAKVGTNGKQYWTIVFSVEIHFGLTEFKARIKWVDSGNTKYGPATIIYNEHGHRSLDEEEPDTYPEDDHAGTPRSERHRSLPASRTASRAASRARTPTEYPSSPAYDGSSMYTGDGGSIRGIPPPSISPHEPARERALSKPATPKATSPIAPPIEREFSTESRRTSVSTSKGRSSRESRASSSAAAPRIGETLPAIWGAGDPQFRSPSQSQASQLSSPHSPTPHAPQAPTPKPISPHTPQTQISQAPVQQMPSQPQTQVSTHKSSKSKSRKASAAATAQHSPQPSLQIPPVVVTQSHHGSPRPAQSPAQAPAAPSLPPSLSRSVSHIASPSQPLSPLNPAMQEPPAQIYPELANTAFGAAVMLDGTSVPEGFVQTDQNYLGEFDAQDNAWGLNEGGDGFDTQMGEGTGTGTWGTTMENYDNPPSDDIPREVPGSFEGGGDNVNLLGGTNQPPVNNATDGEATLLSGSISSLLKSDAVGGLTDRLSSTFGFSSNKNATQSAGGSGFGFGSFFTGNAGGGTASGIELDPVNAGRVTEKAPAWGKSNAGSKVPTPKSATSPEAPEQVPAWGKSKSAAGSKPATPIPPTSPQVAEQRNAWGGAKSTAAPNVVIPNPLASPQLPPVGEKPVSAASTSQVAEQTTAWNKRAKSAAASKVATPNPPASPQVQEQPPVEAKPLSAAASKVPTPNLQSSPLDTVEAADLSQATDLGAEEWNANGGEEWNANGGEELILDPLANVNQDGTAGLEVEGQMDGEAQEEQGAEHHEESVAPEETTAPAAAEEEGDWASAGKNKNKNKKSGKQEAQVQPQVQTPAGEEDTGGFQTRGRKKKGKKGTTNFFDLEEGNQEGENETAEVPQPDNGEGKSNVTGEASGAAQDGDDLLADTPGEENQGDEEDDTQSAKTKKGGGKGGNPEQSGGGGAKGKKKKKR